MAIIVAIAVSSVALVKFVSLAPASFIVRKEKQTAVELVSISPAIHPIADHAVMNAIQMHHASLVHVADSSFLLCVALLLAGRQYVTRLPAIGYAQYAGKIVYGDDDEM